MPSSDPFKCSGPFVCFRQTKLPGGLGNHCVHQAVLELRRALPANVPIVPMSQDQNWYLGQHAHIPFHVTIIKIPVIRRGVWSCSPTHCVKLSHIAGVKICRHICRFRAWSYGVVYVHFGLHLIPEIGLYGRVYGYIFLMPFLSQSYVRVNGHCWATCHFRPWWHGSAVWER